MRGGSARYALAICLAATLWGLDSVVFTPRLGNLPVLFVVFLLHLVPFLLLQPFLMGSYRKLLRMTWRGWLTLFLVGVTGGVLGTYAIVRALFLTNFSGLSIVVLLQKLQPLIALALAALILKERLSPRFLFWAVLALLGAYLVSFGFGTPRVGASTAAVLWALVAAAAFGVATVASKALVNFLDYPSAVFGRFGMTTLLTLLILPLTTGFPFSSVTGQNWLFIIIIALTTGSGALFLYYYGLSRVSASVSTICELCLPASALFFDWLVNGSLLTRGQWVGTLLLLFAVAKASQS